LTLWRTNLFVKFDHLFTTKDLSGVLRVTSLKMMDICIGVQDYHQLLVCIRHAHCPKLDKLTMSLDNKDPAYRLAILVLLKNTYMVCQPVTWVNYLRIWWSPLQEPVENSSISLVYQKGGLKSN